MNEPIYFHGNNLHFDFVHRVEKRSRVTCLYTNADTLTNKMDELELFLNNHKKIDVIAINESLPKNSSSDKNKINFILPGFNCIQNNSGRGVCLFINENLDFVRINQFENYFNPNIFVKISISKDDSFILGVIYRSPVSNEIDNKGLNELFNSVSNTYQNKKIIIIGDFNYPEIDWLTEGCSTKDDGIAFKFLNTIQKNYMTQFVKEPTHYRCQQTPTLIDLIFANDPDFVNNLEHFPAFGLSHHSVLKFDINTFISSENPTVAKFLINKGDYNKMRSFIQNIDWDIEFKSESDINEWWNVFEKKINIAKENFIPRKIVKKSNFRRTFSAPQTLLKALQDKRRSFKYYKKFPTFFNYDVSQRIGYGLARLSVLNN